MFKYDVSYVEGCIYYNRYNVPHSMIYPAVTYNNGSRFWYQYGKLWRDDDLPCIIWPDGLIQRKRYR